MDRKFDKDRRELDNDFESTHRELQAYARAGQSVDAGSARLLWEEKVMRRLKACETRLGNLEDNSHNTQQIATIAQAELKPYLPIRAFFEFCVKWQRRIIRWGATAAVTALVGWYLAKHGIKAP